MERSFLGVKADGPVFQQTGFCTEIAELLQPS
jgi:hypothetical protein